MMQRWLRFGLAGSIVFVGLLAGCSGGNGQGESEAAASDGVPEGRPGGRMAAPELAAPVEVEGLLLRAPASWMTEEPGGSMRKAQYVIPGDAGEASCVLFYFGEGGGGGGDANITRWIQQFRGPDGGDPHADRGSMTNNGLEASTVSVKGTMLPAPMMGGSSEAQEGWAMLGAVVEGPGGPWFFKMTGPEATVTAEQATFNYMITSLEPATP